MSDPAVAESEVNNAQQGGEGGSSGDSVRSAITSAIKEVGERQRDDQGKFTAGAPAPSPAPAAAAAPAPVGAPSPSQAPGPAPAAAGQGEAAAAPAAPPKPPDSWSPAAKAKFSALDPEVQAEVLRREAEVHKGFTKQDEHRTLGKSFSDAVGPYLPMIRADGNEPVKAVQDLLQTVYSMRNGNPIQKQDILLQIANHYQVDLRSLFQRLAGGQPQVHPQVAELQNTVQQLQQRLQQGDQQAQAQFQAQLDADVKAFASDPKNLYFENVRAAMGALINGGQATSLQEAYDMACFAHPQIRALLLQQSEEQKAAEAREKTNRARGAAVSVSGAPTGSAGAGVPENRSLRDEIRANLRAAQEQT